MGDEAEAERQEILEGLRRVKEAFDTEFDRHEVAIQRNRREWIELVARGRAAGVGVTSMSKAMGMSRGRLNDFIAGHITDKRRNYPGDAWYPDELDR